MLTSWRRGQNQPLNPDLVGLLDMVIDEMCMESVHSTSVLVYSSMTSLDICRGCGETASLRQDISDEFKEVIESIKGDGDKCRCVLNKARSIV